MPRAGLFLPCSVDQRYPQSGLRLLECCGVSASMVEFPEAQTGCGQPMDYSGCALQGIVGHGLNSSMHKTRSSGGPNGLRPAGWVHFREVSKRLLLAALTSAISGGGRGSNALDRSCG
jgi:hypothetical protein